VISIVGSGFIGKSFVGNGSVSSTELPLWKDVPWRIEPVPHCRW
jgi:hypothetical protein